MQVLAIIVIVVGVTFFVKLFQILNKAGKSIKHVNTVQLSTDIDTGIGTVRHFGDGSAEVVKPSTAGWLGGYRRGSKTTIHFYDVED